MTKPLRLKAKDAEDLQVISAVLQDAIAPVCDMIYRPEEKDYVMVVHRFCRDGQKPDANPACHERVRCGVHVLGVESAQVHGIDLARTDDMLDLLAVLPDDNSLQFIFAGGGKIRLRLGGWSLILEDFGEPWPTSQCPNHPVETAPT